MADLIEKLDSLNQGRGKINKSIEASERAENKSDGAVNTSAEARDIAKTAEGKAVSVQTQFDQVTAASTIDPAVDQMKVGSDGQTVYNSADERIRAENNELIEQLTHKASVVELEKIVRIPSDFPDLQSAINSNSRNVTQHPNKIVLLVESGHSLTKGVKLINTNLANYIIRSEDDSVKLSDSFEGVNIPERIGSYDTEYTDNLFYAQNAQFPTLDCVIDMESRFGSGLYLDENSHCIITEGSRIVNAGGHGLVARNSRAQANGTDWSGATAYGIRAQTGGIISAQYATADNCEVGVFASRGSMVHFAGGEATDCGVAVQAQRSRITCMDANLKRAKNLASIWAMEGSIISAKGASVDDSLRRGVHAEAESKIDFTSGTALNTGEEPAYTNTGASISMTGADYDVDRLSSQHIPNAWTGKGVILDENQPDHLIKRTLKSGAVITKYPDGKQTITGTINLGPTTDGDGAFANPYRTPQLISFDFPESFYGQPDVFLEATRNDIQLGRLVNASYSWKSSSQLGGIMAWAFTQTDTEVIVAYKLEGRWK